MIGLSRQFVRSITIRFVVSSFLISQRSLAFGTTFQRMQAIRNDGLGGRGVTYIPSSGSYKNVVVWMHGLGDTADGWASLMPSLGLKETKFILPTATNKPISINGGMAMPAWSDIYGLDDRVHEDRSGFDESKERIDRIIQSEIDKGIEPKRIVIAGFSQGGALAFHTSLRSPHTLGACIGLSTWVPLGADYPAALSPAIANMKILQIHGDEDMVVSHRWGEKSFNSLKTWFPTNPPQFKTISGMGHSSDPEETEEVQRFLRMVFEQ